MPLFYKLILRIQDSGLQSNIIFFYTSMQHNIHIQQNINFMINFYSEILRNICTSFSESLPLASPIHVERCHNGSTCKITCIVRTYFPETRHRARIFLFTRPPQRVYVSGNRDVHRVLIIPAFFAFHLPAFYVRLLLSLLHSTRRDRLLFNEQRNLPSALRLSIRNRDRSYVSRMAREKESRRWR